MCWNTIAAGKWKARPWNSGPKGELMAKTSHCQLELDAVSYTHLTLPTT